MADYDDFHDDDYRDDDYRDDDYYEAPGDYRIPKSMTGPMAPRGVVFVDRSRMKGAGMNPLAGQFVDSPFKGMVFEKNYKTFQETYDETYELVKKKHKWLSKPWIDLITKISAIPRHLLRYSISNTTYNPTNVSEMEKEYKNKY